MIPYPEPRKEEKAIPTPASPFIRRRTTHGRSAGTRAGEKHRVPQNTTQIRRETPDEKGREKRSDERRSDVNRTTKGGLVPPARPRGSSGDRIDEPMSDRTFNASMTAAKQAGIAGEGRGVHVRPSSTRYCVYHPIAAVVVQMMRRRWWSALGRLIFQVV